MSRNLLELLADPVRLSIVRQIASRQPATLEEIAAGASVHDNTVRSHLAQLEESGAVMREHAQTHRPGRPQVLYRLREDWRLPSSDMRGLVELLAALVLRMEPSPDQLQDLGRQWGGYLAGRPGPEVLERLPRQLERLGFDAHLEGDDLRLSACPCPLAAPEHPEFVCQLVNAVVAGLAGAAAGGLRVTSSVHDPNQRRCTIKLGDRRRGGSPLPIRAT
jgi:predicted ArsR family transcriptional regulator